jgi:predicted transcriptional regulator
MRAESSVKKSVRDEILDHISDYPGITFASIRRAFRMNEGTLRYHLDHLVKEEKIKQTEKGERKYYSLDGSKKRRIEGLSKDQTRVLMIIKGNPGISSSRIRVLTGLGREETKYIIRKLKDRRFIFRTGSGKDPRYQFITKEDLANEMMRIILERSMNGEMDKKTFDILKAKIDETLDG